jgi:hypothetical protein
MTFCKGLTSVLIEWIGTPLERESYAQARTTNN